MGGTMKRHNYNGQTLASLLQGGADYLAKSLISLTRHLAPSPSACMYGGLTQNFGGLHHEH